MPRSQLAPVRVAEYGGVETEFDAFALLAPSAKVYNRWYTFPAMQNDEVAVFLAFDSERVTKGLPFWTPHCAFDDTQREGSPLNATEYGPSCWECQQSKGYANVHKWAIAANHSDSSERLFSSKRRR